MAFTKTETRVIDSFYSTRRLGPEWDGSRMRDIVLTGPSTKSSFARKLVAEMAAAANVSFTSVPGRTGGRRRVGSCICEIKFSTEHPARFQQVRPPDDGYDLLLCVGAHPKDFVYWLIPGDDVQRLIDEGEITYQHADRSLWFFPDVDDEDAFSSFRMREKALIAALRSLE